MDRSTWPRVLTDRLLRPTDDEREHERLRADGGRSDDGEGSEDGERSGTDRPSDEQDAEPALDTAGVDVVDAGEAEPADPKWEKPDLDDLPEFELRADEPAVKGSSDGSDAAPDADDPTAGMPNTAGVPGTRLAEGETEGYIAALELCARLPDDVRLPEEAADLVPAAVEAELEQDVQSFAAAEFDDASPHVDTLSFVERDGDVWLRLRVGVPPGAFADLDPEEIRTHALQQLDGVF